MQQVAILSVLDWGLVSLALSVILLFIFVITLIKMNKVIKQYKQLMEGSEGKNLENVLLRKMNEVEQNRAKIKQVSERVEELTDVVSTCLQRQAVVRFNAFNDMGSDLSFAVALMDDGGNGLVLSSLFGRDDTRIYAKPLVKGESKYPLSGEEKQAIELAMKR